MPRLRRGYGYSASSLRFKRDVENGGINLVEIDRTEFQDYVIVAYFAADGPADDIATLIERRLAIFLKDKLPDNPYNLGKDAHHFYGAYEGLPECELDEVMEIHKERDAEAMAFRDESDALMDRPDAWSSGVERLTFAKFLEAVGKVKEDDTDEEAWNIIDQWRTRRLRGEERVV